MGRIDRVGHRRGHQTIAHPRQRRHAPDKRLIQPIHRHTACRQDKRAAGHGGQGATRVRAFCHHRAIGPARDIARHLQLHPRLDQPCLHKALFVGIHRPSRGHVLRRHIGDVMALPRQPFGQGASHEVMLVVIYHHGAAYLGPRKDIIRRQSPRKDARRHAQHAHPVPPPDRACCQHHMIRTKARHIVSRHGTFRIQRHVGQLGQHRQAPIAHTAPSGQTRQGAFAVDPAPRLPFGKGHRNLKPALA